MKILWITPWFGNYRVSVYAHLNRMCVGDFFLICSRKETSNLVRDKLKATLGCNVIILDGESDFSLGDQSSDFANKGLVIKWQKGLYNTIKAINPDLIITEGFGGWAPVGIWYAALYCKKILIFYERTAYVERNSPLWRTLYRRVIGHFASGFIINGSLTRIYLKHLGFGNYPMVEGCMVADCKGLCRSVNAMTEREKLSLCLKIGLTKKGLTYLFIGQLVERKGIRQLLEAWVNHINKYPQDHIIIVGDGVLRNELEEKYGNEHSIFILGSIGYDMIHCYYAISDVFVMPTLEDNWSLVVPEAMACGLPVATTIYNGCHVELVKNGENGYVFDALQQEDIVRMLSNFHQADLAGMGKKSKEIVKDYTPEIAAMKIYELSLKICIRKKNLQ